MNLLHIDSSILADNSVSRTLSREIVDKLCAARPDLQLVYRDLAAHPLPHLSGAMLAAAQNSGGEHEALLQADLAASGETLREFLAADVVVIGVALYNFTVPSQLKAWVDRIVIAGQTFRYGPNGAEGLAGGKRVILAVARGGHYGPGAPAESFEHAETYLRTVFGFIGVRDLEVVVAEGIAVGPEQREIAIAGAKQQISALAA